MLSSRISTKFGNRSQVASKDFFFPWIFNCPPEAALGITEDVKHSRCVDCQADDLQADGRISGRLNFLRRADCTVVKWG